jgi:hypothetical protein
VLYIIRGAYLLIAGVLHADEIVGRRTVDVDVEVLVDGRAENEAAVL